jgi:hypothetical protein
MGRKNPRTRNLKARHLDVIYPSYQAAEPFGRFERKVSLTDRKLGRVQENLLGLFPVFSFPGGLRDSQSSVLPPAGRCRRRPVHQHVGCRLRRLQWRLRRWL